MKIYAACLASYNNGRLHGRWIDLDGKDADDVREEIAEMLRESPHPNVTITCPECDGDGRGSHVASCLSDERRPCPVCEGRGEVPSAEEWAIHDYDDLPSTFGESPDLDNLIAYCDAVDEHGEAFAAFWDAQSETEVDVDAFRDAYIGEFDSWADLAEHLVDEQGLLSEVPDTLARYFDFESYGRDLRVGGEAFEHDGHYFWNH